MLSWRWPHRRALAQRRVNVRSRTFNEIEFLLKLLHHNSTFIMYYLQFFLICYKRFDIHCSLRQRETAGDTCVCGNDSDFILLRNVFDFTAAVCELLWLYLTCALKKRKQGGTRVIRKASHCQLSINNEANTSTFYLIMPSST